MLLSSKKLNILRFNYKRWYLLNSFTYNKEVYLIFFFLKKGKKLFTKINRCSSQNFKNIMLKEKNNTKDDKKKLKTTKKEIKFKNEFI